MSTVAGDSQQVDSVVNGPQRRLRNSNIAGNVADDDVLLETTGGINTSTAVPATSDAAAGEPSSGDSSGAELTNENIIECLRVLLQLLPEAGASPDNGVISAIANHLADDDDLPDLCKKFAEHEQPGLASASASAVMSPNGRSSNRVLLPETPLDNSAAAQLQQQHSGSPQLLPPATQQPPPLSTDALEAMKKALEALGPKINNWQLPAAAPTSAAAAAATTAAATAAAMTLVLSELIHSALTRINRHKRQQLLNNNNSTTIDSDETITALRALLVAISKCTELSTKLWSDIIRAGATQDSKDHKVGNNNNNRKYNPHPGSLDALSDDVWIHNTLEPYKRHITTPCPLADRTALFDNTKAVQVLYGESGVGKTVAAMQLAAKNGVGVLFQCSQLFSSENALPPVDRTTCPPDAPDEQRQRCAAARETRNHDVAKVVVNKVLSLFNFSLADEASFIAQCVASASSVKEQRNNNNSNNNNGNNEQPQNETESEQKQRVAALNEKLRRQTKENKAFVTLQKRFKRSDTTFTIIVDEIGTNAAAVRGMCAIQLAFRFVFGRLLRCPVNIILVGSGCDDKNNFAGTSPATYAAVRVPASTTCWIEMLAALAQTQPAMKEAAALFDPRLSSMLQNPRFAALFAQELLPICNRDRQLSAATAAITVAADNLVGVAHGLVPSALQQFVNKNGLSYLNDDSNRRALKRSLNIDDANAQLVASPAVAARMALTVVANARLNISALLRRVLIETCGLMVDTTFYIDPDDRALVRRDTTAAGVKSRNGNEQPVHSNLRPRFDMSTANAAMALADFSGALRLHAPIRGVSAGAVFENIVADTATFLCSLPPLDAELDNRDATTQLRRIFDGLGVTSNETDGRTTTLRVPPPCKIEDDPAFFNNVQFHQKLVRDVNNNSNNNSGPKRAVVMLNKDQAQYADIVVLSPNKLVLLQCKYHLTAKGVSAKMVEIEFTKMGSPAYPLKKTVEGGGAAGGRGGRGRGGVGGRGGGGGRGAGGDDAAVAKLKQGTKANSSSNKKKKLTFGGAVTQKLVEICRGQQQQQNFIVDFVIVHVNEDNSALNKCLSCAKSGAWNISNKNNKTSELATTEERITYRHYCLNVRKPDSTAAKQLENNTDDDTADAADAADEDELDDDDDDDDLDDDPLSTGQQQQRQINDNISNSDAAVESRKQPLPPLFPFSTPVIQQVRDADRALHFEREQWERENNELRMQQQQQQQQSSTRQEQEFDG